MDLEKELTILDAPEIIRFIFYPRKQASSVNDTNEAYTIKFEVEDGIAIGGRFYKTNNPKEAPTILLFHGNGEIAADYDHIASLYQKMGINLIVVDYRGYGISSGSPSFSSMLLDAKIVYQQLRIQLLEDEYLGSFSIMGRSLGSASAIILAEKYQSQIANLIIESGFANTIALLRRLGLDRDFSRELESKLSLTSVINNITIPTLIIHGERDSIIPVSEGRDLYSSVSSVNKKLVIIPNAGHNDLLLVDPSKYMTGIKELLNV